MDNIPNKTGVVFGQKQTLADITAYRGGRSCPMDTKDISVEKNSTHVYLSHKLMPVDGHCLVHTEPRDGLQLHHFDFVLCRPLEVMLEIVSYVTCPHI